MLLTTLLLLAQESGPLLESVLLKTDSRQDPVTRLVRIYEVTDLVAPPSAAPPAPDGEVAEEPPGGSPGLGSPGQQVAGIPELDAVEIVSAPFESGAALVESVEAFLWPRLDREHESLQMKKRLLVADLREEQHAWLQRFLHAHRGMQPWMGQVEARFYALPRGGAAKLGLERAATLLEGPEAAQAFLDKLAAGEHQTLSAPSLMTYPGQRANISVLSQVAYVKDFELKVVEPQGVEIADPVVDVVQEGNVLDVRVLAIDEGLYGMRLKSQIAQLERPIKTRKLRLGPGPQMEVEVGVPEVVTASLVADLRMRDGDAVVLFSPSADDKDMLIVVRFAVLALGEDGRLPAAPGLDDVTAPEPGGGER